MNSAPVSELRRLLQSAGIYAAAGLAQRGVGFLLIPVYTRLIDPADYGMLELFNAFAAVLFACLTLGLSSAINKCYHRDCETPAERRSVLPTAIFIDLPVLLIGSVLLLIYAEPMSRWLLGRTGGESLLWLVVISGVFFSLDAQVLAGLRAQERATAFGTLALAQFTFSLLLNVVLVVYCRWGVAGVLWGNLLANAASLPVAWAVADRHATRHFDRRLLRPLLQFGIYLVPVMLAGWVMDVSDRYILRIYRSLDEVAVYGIGYKFGMMLDLAIVWPFQLAWPAFSFAISKRLGHQRTYAQTLTYLSLALTAGAVMLALCSRQFLPTLLGPAYHGAYRVVPFIALAYACNGLQYCVAPGVHLAGKTRILSLIAVLAALLNLAASFVLIPRLGMMGAAYATLLAFVFMAGGTAWVAQRSYPVPYEYRRLAKIAACGALVYAAAMLVTPGRDAVAIAWHVLMPLIAFPALLAAVGFLDHAERALLWGQLRRLPFFRAPHVQRQPVP